MRTFKTKKHLGQHLLISEGVIKKIVDEIDVTPEDIIVEIGVGTGQLTEEILKRKPEILYGIEIDKTVYPLIEERLGSYKNFILIKDNFFKVDLKKLSEGKKIKLVGNLPYNVASHILVRTVEEIEIIERYVFMLQKEVAEKLIAKPRTKSYSFLTVFIQSFYRVEYVMSVPARFFKPPPKVTSAVVKMIPEPKLETAHIKQYREFLSKLFSNRRKMIKSKVDSESIKKAGIKETARAEELSVEDFIRLFKAQIGL